MEPEDYHLFEKYLNNDLSESEKTEFEQRISSDPEFADTFETYKDIQVGLEARESRAENEEALLQNIRTISNDYFDNKPAEKATKVISMKTWVSLAAASVVILLGVVFYFNRHQPQPLYAQYAKYESLALAERGHEDSLKTVAEQTFNNKQYDKAAIALEELLQKEPENTEAKLYLGIALTETNQFDSAESVFREIQKGGSVFANKATWHLALNYLKQDKKDACKSALKQIPEGADEYEDATKLLEEL